MRERFFIFSISLVILTTHSSLGEGDQENFKSAIREITVKADLDGEDRYTVNSKRTQANAMDVEPMGEISQRIIESGYVTNLTSSEQSTVFFVEDTISYLKNIREKVQYFLTKNTQLEDVLFNQGFPISDIRQSFGTVGNIIAPEFWGANMRKGKEDLRTLTLDELEVHRKDLQYALSILQEYNKYLLYKLKTTPAASSARIAGAPRIDLLPSTEHDQQAGDLRQVVAGMRREISNLESRLAQKDEQMRGSHGQIVNLSLQSSEKNAKINQILEKLAQLENDYAALKSRFDLGEKIIGEKNSQLQVIQDKITELQKTAARQEVELKSKDETIVELTGILQIYKSKLSDATQQTKQGDKTIRLLGDRLITMKSEFERKLVILQEAQKNIKAIEGELTNIQTKIEEIKSKAQPLGPPENIPTYEIENDISNLRGKIQTIKQRLTTQFSGINSSGSSQTSAAKNKYLKIENRQSSRTGVSSPTQDPRAMIVEELNKYFADSNFGEVNQADQ